MRWPLKLISIMLLFSLILAPAMVLGPEKAKAAAPLIIEGNPGDTISYSGYGTAGSVITIELSASISVPTYDGDGKKKYRKELNGITVPEGDNYMLINVYPVESMYLTGSLSSIPITYTVEGYMEGTTGAYQRSNTPPDSYNLAAYGNATGGSSSVTMYVKATQQRQVGGDGRYTVTLSSSGLPAAVYTVKQDGVAVATVYLGVPAPVHFTLNLKAGWNLISLPIVPQDGSVTGIFAGHMDNIYVIWEFSGGNWHYFTTEAGYTNQFTAMNERQGYWIYCYNPMTVDIQGSLPSDTAIEMGEIPSGWNLIGYPSFNARSVTDLYSGAYVVWKFQDSQWSYFTLEQGYEPQFTTLEPGLGYWIYKD